MHANDLQLHFEADEATVEFSLMISFPVICSARIVAAVHVVGVVSVVVLQRTLNLVQLTVRGVMAVKSRRFRFSVIHRKTNEDSSNILRVLQYLMPPPLPVGSLDQLVRSSLRCMRKPER